MCHERNQSICDCSTNQILLNHQPIDQTINQSTLTGSALVFILSDTLPELFSPLPSHFYFPLLPFILVIGRGGEQITRIQLESGCKIQIASGKQPSICPIMSDYTHFQPSYDIVTNIRVLLVEYLSNI